MIILVLNSGSSSIKYQLIDMKSSEAYKVLAKGQVEKIGLPEGNITLKPADGEKRRKILHIPDHKQGMKLVLNALTNPEFGVIKDFSDIEAVGHRVVQGAEYFRESALVSEDVLKKIEECSDFAPLHNPANLLGIRTMQEVLPDVPQVVVFDTAFHQTMPAYAYMYALPLEYYEKYHIRRYGAHGTSHQFVSGKGAEFAGLDLQHSRIITCHLGNGSSITAVKDGKSIDTSMGFTPLEGMIMGTRCGNIDASIVTYLMKKENLSPDQITEIFNKKSGFLGLSGGQSSDARDINELAQKGERRAKVVWKKLTFDIVKLIGAYTAEMGGVDLIVFTAGIGENNPALLLDICSQFGYMGVKMDEQATMQAKGNTMLSAPDSKVKVALIPTDEELVIARDTMRIASALED